MSTESIKFQVIDRHTGAVVGTYSTRSRASRAVDRKDNEYGAYRYTVRTIYPTLNDGVPSCLT